MTILNRIPVGWEYRSSYGCDPKKEWEFLTNIEMSAGLRSEWKRLHDKIGGMIVMRINVLVQGHGKTLEESIEKAIDDSIEENKKSKALIDMGDDITIFKNRIGMI